MPEPLHVADRQPAKLDQASPLRYPGSKRKLVPALQALIGDRRPQIFVEPFAGGASVSLRLLELGLVETVILADLDPMLAGFWHVAATESEWLIDAMRSEPVTVERWDYWRQTIPTDERHHALRCLFLNRTTFSGILQGRAGPIGGRAQNSEYKIDCRFNKDRLERQIKNIARLHRDGRILDVWHGSWRETLEKVSQAAYPPSSTLLYLDPPYIEKAHRLYNLSFNDTDHRDLAAYLTAEAERRWILSYDEEPTVIEKYRGRPGVRWFRPDHKYTAKAGHKQDPGREILLTNLPQPSVPPNP